MPRHPDTIITPNTLLAQARQRRTSPRRLGQQMSRAELADAINVALDDVMERLIPFRDVAEVPALLADRWAPGQGKV